MIKSVRPWQIFEHLGVDREVAYSIPSHKGRESETVSSLETLLLVSVIRSLKVRTLLELGTCMGYNSMQLVSNTPVTVVTVDRNPQPCVFEGKVARERIKMICADIFNFSLSDSSFDMVFCDINYTPETVARCTEIAFDVSPKVVGWHDYGHPELPHVKPFLDNLAVDRDLISVGDSSLVFWFLEGF